MHDDKITRRRFVAGIGATGIALAAPAIAPAKLGANERIRVGFIGTGGRMFHSLIPSVMKLSGADPVVACDVWDAHLERAVKMLGGKVDRTKDYRRVLDRDDVDAVVIATPDHLHAPITVAACEAGKDVYVEKPLTHDVEEGQRVIAAQNEHSRIVQVGMQQRSMPHIQKAIDYVRKGRLGKVHKVHLTWNRNSAIGKRHRYGIDPKSVDWKAFLGGAPEQPFDEYRFRNWRWFWDFGGGILTDLMVHHIDIVNWFLGLDHPAWAATMGDHFRAAGVWETPDTIQTLLHYPGKDVQLYFEGTFVNARNRAMIEIMGTEGTLYMDRGRYEFHPEGGGEVEKLVLGEGGPGRDFYDRVDGGLAHVENWLSCVRSRKQPNAPAEAGVAAVSGAHLGNAAYLRKQALRWDEFGSL